MLKQRVLTALVLIPLFVWAVLSLPTFTIALLLGAVVLLGAWEWSKLFPWTTQQRTIFFIAFVFVLVVGYWAATRFFGIFFILSFASLWWFVAALWVANVQRGLAASESQVTHLSSRFVFLNETLLGMIVLVPCYVAVLALHADERLGPGVMLFCLTLMWVADTAAYFTGRKWGRRKLASAVSPGKSWEGAIGALLFSTLWAMAGAFVLDLSLAHTISFIVLVVIAVGFSIVGDLFESMFKRRAHVKDSGALLPGHGGVLDRIDSVTAGAPVFALGMFLLK